MSSASWIAVRFDRGYPLSSPDRRPDEPDRLAALARLEVCGSPPEQRFDALTVLAAHLLGCPVALITFIDENRQWVKARYGLEVTETPRDLAFCDHVVHDRTPLVVPDTHADDRFADHPFVLGEPHIRFYAGVPLATPEGHVLGTLCVLDHQPRQVKEQEVALLGTLADQVMAQLELRGRQRALESREVEAEARLQALFRCMTEGVVVQDRSGAIQRSNTSAERLLGLTTDQLAGRTSIDPRWSATRGDGSPFPGDEHPAMVSLRTGEPQRDVLMGVRHATGERRWIRVNSEPVSHPGQPPHAVVATFRDTTEQWVAEESLAEERAFLAAMLRQMPGTLVAVFDDQLQIKRVFGTETGASRVGRPLEELVDQHDRPSLRDAAQRVLGGGRVTIDLSRGERRFELRLVPLLFDRDRFECGLVLAVDVTERDRLRERLDRQQRLVATGTLAAGVGHELANPLTWAGTHLECAVAVLGRADAPSPAVAEALPLLSEAAEGLDRMRHVVRGLRSFARTEAVTAPVELGAALELASHLAMHEIRHRATLSCLPGPAVTVSTDESRLSQIVVQLLVNAAQCFSTADPDRNRIALRSGAEDGAIWIEVEDNGPGIPAELLPRLFDPFFTTRPVGQGTGLGLAIVQGLVAGLGGQVTVDTEVGRGTSFRVVLPTTSSEAVPVPAPSPRAERAPRRGRVLVVDDEPPMLRSIRRLVGDAHDVTALDDPREALALLTAGDAPAFDVVLCDVMMPNLTGIELYERVRDARPDLAARFVFMTGGVTFDSVRAFFGQVRNERLDKPFGGDRLRQVLRRYLPPGR